MLKKRKQPSQQLLLARRCIDELAFCKLRKDLLWYDQIGKWVVNISIKVQEGNEVIPAETDWYIIIDEEYPKGSIDFYPSKQNGITATFHHQMNNNCLNEHPWRNGNICCFSPMKNILNDSYDTEPKDPDSRLNWYIHKAYEWINAAIRNDLVRPGEPFELPHFFNKHSDKENIVFIENSETYSKWKNFKDLRYGFVVLEQYREVKQVFVVDKYLDANRGGIVSYSKGSFLSNKKPTKKLYGVWIKLKEIPVLKPYQAPLNWVDLKNILYENNISFEDVFQFISQWFRNGREFYILIGFPIPHVFDGDNQLYNWQSIKMPALSHGVINGYRTNAQLYQRRDLKLFFSDTSNLNWIPTQNWDSEVIQNRGRYSEQLRNKSIVLIGAGAFGACLAEILVRAGIKKMVVIDYDTLDVGNLTRHTLCLTDLTESKANKLAERLSSLNPNCNVQALRSVFSLKVKDIEDFLSNYDIIIDCTGDDNVISDLQNLNLSDKIFVSCSIGLFAKRLYLFLHKGSNLPGDIFFKHLAPYLKLDISEHTGEQIPWEGYGCWHPVYPAKADDIWLMVSIISKNIENAILYNNLKENFMVFEQSFDTGNFHVKQTS